MVNPTHKILLLGRYESLAASTRYRLLQYVPYLEQAGFCVQFEPLLDDAYLTRLFSGQRAARADVVHAYVRRMQRMLSSDEFDVIWIYFEALPWLPHWLESLLLRSRAPVIVDYDDAIFHRYDQHRFGVVRRLLGSKIDSVMRNATVVTAGNAYLAERALNAGSQRVEIIPTVVDITRYGLKNWRESQQGEVVGWIGSPSSAQHLSVIEGPVRELSREEAVKLRLVGAGNMAWTNIPVENLPWTQETEVQDIQSFDMGVMPLIDGPFERGKCGFKLIQYMACGIPVVGSPVGVNREIIRPGVNGFLAENASEWVSALRTLVKSPTLREQMGAAGRRIVEEKYSLQVTAPQLTAVFQSVV